MGKDQEFLEAARNGNIGYIEKVLTQKAKRAGPLASLRRGTGVNVQDSGGYSALHHACLNGHHDIVRLLLAHEASPNLPDSRGSSPLHLAAWAGETEIVKMLLTHPYRPANASLQTIENETPLHCAAQHGHTGALALLLAHDADPNMRNSRGETPLDLAAQYGRLQAVQMLIRAHPELIAPFSTAAIEGGIGGGSGGGGGGIGIHTHAQHISQTHNKSRHSSPLPHSGSVSTPSPSSPSVHSSSPATPTRNIFPHTCLHLASRNGHKCVVEVLLAAGVCVNLLTPSGTALHEASLCGKENVVRTLLKAGIDLSATDAEGRTALDILKEFPPHVTKHIIAVINNFRNQMDTDDSEEVIYRHHTPMTAAILTTTTTGRGAGMQHSQKQQHNNHYHFNSNNHLLNHSHSMQQSSYSKQRFSTGGSGGVGGNFNGGKSLDSSLQPDDVSVGVGVGSNRFYHDINSPVHSQSNASQNDMGISPSSSMSSFEPASVSPRSRSSTGGIIGYGNNNTVHHMSTFAPGAPPKKPPRRNLSVSPTHAGQQQQFSYTSPNHQQQPGQSTKRQQRSPSNDSPYSHQSHGSVGGMSFDETQMRERQRGDRLYASARESTRSGTGMPHSSSNDMLDRQCNSSDTSYVPNDVNATTHSMKRPIPAPRSNTLSGSGSSNVSKEIINCENPTLKSYNPNRKLKRNRNTYAIALGADMEHCSQSSDSNSDPKQQIPSSPTNYKQPPTPDHPPPSSSQAERTIHERIRPLSQEYKRRSALLQLQQQQQLMIDTSTSPPKPIMISTTSYEFAYEHSPPTNTVIPFYHASGTQGSSGSLSSSISCSDHSLSTDCVEEFIGDVPFAGLLKGAATTAAHEVPKPMNVRVDMNNDTNTKIKQNQQQQQPQSQQLATTKTTTREHIARIRPPIPTKPILPERKYVKPPQVPPRKDIDAKSEHSLNSGTNGHNIQKEDLQEEREQEHEQEEKLSRRSFNSTKDGKTKATESCANSITNTVQIAAPESSSLLSPFNAEEARKKISEIIESFGSGILNTNITPTHDIELDFEDLEVPAARRELALRLRNVGLLHLERMLSENGYDNYKFVHNVFEEHDLELLEIPVKDAAKLLRFISTLPLPEFQTQISNKIGEQENKPSTTNTTTISDGKGVATLSQWLNSIALPEYLESFNKHLYNTIESVCGVWDVELQTVLEINKLGHRRRILQSLAYIRNMREPKSVKTPLGECNATNKMTTNGGINAQPLQPTQPAVQHRNSITSYRKSRPAPQPPVAPNSTHNNNNSNKNSNSKDTLPTLQIRAPSELLLGLPASLRTKWRHSANALLNDQIKYEVYYLGSTVVKELRGTESTRKSIQKFKQDQMSSTIAEASNSTQPHQLARNSSFNRQQRRALLSLAISHRGVEFIDTQRKHTICEHEIQNINCACQDSDDLSYFAYITKENDMHYCHVFNVESTDLATEIILTLGQAFEVAYQLALRDGISTTPAALDNGLLQGEYCNAVEQK